MGQFRAKFKPDPNAKVVPFKCRRPAACPGVMAQIRKINPGMTQFICTTCGHTTGINQGGAVSL